MITRRAVLAGILSVLGTSGLRARGQTITFVSPFGYYGSNTHASVADLGNLSIAQKLAAAITSSLDGALFDGHDYDSRPGRYGMLAADAVAKAAPDGNTVLIHSTAHLVNAALYPRLGYDTLGDFIGITSLVSQPYFLLVSPAKGYKDVADLVAKARAKPGAFSYAVDYGSSTGQTAMTLNAEHFRVTAGIQARRLWVGNPADAEHWVLDGRIDWCFSPLLTRTGLWPRISNLQNLQVLAVGTLARSPRFPDVPSITEALGKDAAYQFWLGLFVPAKTPKAICERLHSAALQALSLPKTQEDLAFYGAEPMPMSQTAFERFLVDDARAAAILVEASGLKHEIR